MGGSPRQTFNAAAAELNKATDSLDSSWSRPIRYVPVLGRNASALDTMAATGASLAETAASAAGVSNLDGITLADGQIDKSGAGWLREVIFHDGKVDANERAFLQKLKKTAKDKTSLEFEKLYEECVASKK